jgi:hypothetical protein
MIRAFVGMCCFATAVALVLWLGSSRDADVRAVSRYASDRSIARVESAVAARGAGRDEHLDALLDSLDAGADLELSAVAAERLGELRQLRNEERRASASHEPASRESSAPKSPTRAQTPPRRDSRVDVALARLVAALEPARPAPKAVPSYALLAAIAALSAFGGALVATSRSSTRRTDALPRARRTRHGATKESAPSPRARSDDAREDHLERPALDRPGDDALPGLGFGRILEISAVDE